MGRNGGRQRTKLEKEHDRAEIASRYLQGQSQSSIARDLSLSQQMVSVELRRLRQGWRRDAKLDIDLHVKLELMRLQMAEVEFWMAWDRSKADRVTIVSNDPERHVRTKVVYRTSAQSGDSQPHSGSPTVVPSSQTQEQNRVGDPNFLKGLLRCIDLRCKLLGLYGPICFYSSEPQEHEPIAPVGTQPDEPMMRALANQISVRRFEQILAQMTPERRQETLREIEEIEALGDYLSEWLSIGKRPETKGQVQNG